ncbi:hypothetical protein [Neoroseomonas soli]|uniref:Uncharacterized protein n=1 Tax=Neoroseomonas soli TaxID=1081025 RepID=A0A9X9WV50_9PROT|nr:hypothetical protein [Neoroseomonas soli]MBR0671029.1 hypothetical protein [Neoroseomonas soli]
MRPASALLLPVFLAALPWAPAGAQGSDATPPLPRVVYGAPAPSVIYGPSSPAPPREIPAEARPAPPPAQPETSLRYESGPAYVPPLGYWAPPPLFIHPPRHMRPLPPVSVPAARGGYYEPPQPPGTYIGRPPSAPPEPQRGLERGLERPWRR